MENKECEKVEILLERSITVDIAAERNRFLSAWLPDKDIRKDAYPEPLKRQLNILERIAEGDWEAARRLYAALPYDNEEECSETEYCGLYLEEILEAVYYDGATVKEVRQVPSCR